MRRTSSPFGQQMPPGIFSKWPAVDDDEVLAGRSHRRHRARRQPRRVALVFDDLPERFARDIHPGIEPVSGPLPRLRAPAQDRDIAIAKRRSPGGCAYGDAVAAVI
jgi:hypothetical protein